MVKRSATWTSLSVVPVCGNAGSDGEEGNVNSAFAEGALGSGEATGGSLIDLAGGAVVADDDDVGVAHDRRR